jgi:hypothetical protein
MSPQAPIGHRSHFGTGGSSLINDDATAAVPLKNPAKCQAVLFQHQATWLVTNREHRCAELRKTVLKRQKRVPDGAGNLFVSYCIRTRYSPDSGVRFLPLATPKTPWFALLDNAKAISPPDTCRHSLDIFRYAIPTFHSVISTERKWRDLLSFVVQKRKGKDISGLSPSRICSACRTSNLYRPPAERTWQTFSNFEESPPSPTAGTYTGSTHHRAITPHIRALS